MTHLHNYLIFFFFTFLLVYKIKELFTYDIPYFFFIYIYIWRFLWHQKTYIDRTIATLNERWGLGQRKFRWPTSQYHKQKSSTASVILLVQFMYQSYWKALTTKYSTLISKLMLFLYLIYDRSRLFERLKYCTCMEQYMGPVSPVRYK